MKHLLVLLFIISFDSHAALKDFAGNYQVTSGKDQSSGCLDYEITLEDGPTIKITEAHGSTVIEEIASINKGAVNWRYDWGDGVKKGKQTNSYDGKNKISHEVRTFFNTFLYRHVVLILENKTLTVTRIFKSKETKCVLKKL